MRNETIKRNKYIDAWESFIARNDEDTAQSRRDMRFTNANRGGAPKISTFGMCLSGAFSQGAMEMFHHLAKEKFPDPPTPDNPTGTYSYLIARHNGFSDWWMRIFQQNVFNCVAKAVMSGIRIRKANAPTALPMDHAVEILHMEPTWSYSKRIQLDALEQRDLQHPRNQSPPPFHLRDLSTHPMDAMVSTSSNANPSTASDVRSRPISNNSAHAN